MVVTPTFDSTRNNVRNNASIIGTVLAAATARKRSAKIKDFMRIERANFSAQEAESAHILQ